MFMYIHIHMFRVYIYICLYIYIHIHIYIYVYVYTYIHIYIYIIRIQRYIFMCVYIYRYMDEFHTRHKLHTYIWVTRFHTDVCESRTLQASDVVKRPPLYFCAHSFHTSHELYEEYVVWVTNCTLINESRTLYAGIGRRGATAIGFLCTWIGASLAPWTLTCAQFIGVLRCVAMCCSVLQCVAVCCSVLQCVAVCCSVW